jgi:hypothetical protein
VTKATASTAAGRGGHRLFHAVVIAGLSLPTAAACGGRTEEASAPGAPADAAGESASAESSIEQDTSSPEHPALQDGTSDSASTDSAMVAQDALAEGDTGGQDAAGRRGDSGSDAALPDAMGDRDACVVGPPYYCCPHPCVLQ